MRGSRQRYLGENIFDNSKVIIESLHETMLSNESALAEFRYQIEISKKLNGPYFMGFKETLTSNGVLFLVWDFVDAQPLSRNSSLGDLTPRDICSFISKVAQALKLSYSKGVPHGALSTDTILITPSLNPVIIGFIDPTSTQSFDTDPGTIDGVSSFAAAAPEIKNGQKPTLVSDLYSLGIIAQFLFSKVARNASMHNREISPEILWAKRSIFGLISSEMDQRISSSEIVIDPNFIDSMATPPSGTPAVKLTKKQVRKVKKSQRKPRTPLNDSTKMYLIVAAKALAISTVGIGILLITLKLVESN